MQERSRINDEGIMNAKEKVNEGKRLLKEAVLEYVAAHPGATSREVKDDLGLASPDENGKHEDQLLWGIDNILIVEGKMRMELVGHRNRRRELSAVCRL